MKSFESLVDASTRAAIQQNSQIRQLISRIVPAESLLHVLFTRIENKQLHITIDNAAWLVKIRFLERQLIDTLRQNRFELHSVSYHVAPQTQVEKRNARRRKNRSGDRNVVALETLAQDLQGSDKASDNELRLQLLRLAKIMRGSDQSVE
ncbi:MAG: DUF721 domain-containing protein [Granulosicoccus sp.]|nr:DUF721 domain-containing protein [Granulosicoccus sp.]